MNCHRRECAVTMQQIDAFPRISSSGPVITAGMIAALGLVFAVLAFLA